MTRITEKEKRIHYWKIRVHFENHYLNFSVKLFNRSKVSKKDT